MRFQHEGNRILLNKVVATRFIRKMATGRTSPCLMNCIYEGTDAEVEVIVKLWTGCTCAQKDLMREAISAMLAADLGLPVPEPFIVWLGEEIAGIIPDNKIKSLAIDAIGYNFGSRRLPSGFSAFSSSNELEDGLLQEAAEILAFDVFVDNVDRRKNNPNMLLGGNKLAIYDHELAFGFDVLLFRKNPWERDGIDKGILNNHVLFEKIRGRDVDFVRLQDAFNSLSDSRLQEYARAIPSTWILDEGEFLSKTLKYITDLRANIGLAIDQLRIVLR